MRLARHIICLGLLLVPCSSVPAGSSVDGQWKLSYVTAGISEQAAAIVKLQSRDGKVVGELVAGSPRMLGLSLKSVTLDGSSLRIELQVGSTDLQFDGVAGRGAMTILGSFAIADNLFPASMTTTTQTVLDAKEVARMLPCPPLQQARALAQKGLTLRFQAQQKKDAEEKKRLLEQASAADAAARRETPGLYKQVLAEHGDSPAVFEAALSLIRAAKQNGSTAVEAKEWASQAYQAAARYGPRWQSELAVQIATAAAGQDALAAVALDYAGRAEKQLTAQTPVATQARVLTLFVQTLRKSGKKDEAAAVSARLAKLQDELDRDYLAKVPPFKGTAFAGRKTKSDRVVFMELFTGAQCPPCVAADIAFDVLAKTYQPTELVLIQYHMHIPGPDPMTNPDTEARWDYYRNAFPQEIRGVPSSVFNGKPAAGGGGGMAAAEKKYHTYRQVIDPLLEQASTVKLAAQAARKGNQIDIDVTVSGLKDAGSSKKLRILLVEETIRYEGSNKIRFHHHVVRAFPGGVAGRALTAKDSKHRASINLDQLRGDLTKYLDDYEATKRPFPNPERPLAFQNLRIVAMVQDDATQEILQVTQIAVEGERAGGARP